MAFFRSHDRCQFACAHLAPIRALLPALEKSKGAVLNVGSILAHCGRANLLAYSVTKGGLMTMTRNLSHSLGPVQAREPDQRRLDALRRTSTK